MLFNSTVFLIFLPIVFAVFWYHGQRLRLQNLIIVLASYIFYGWWDYRFLGLILVSSFADFILGTAIYRARNHGAKKCFLICSLTINLGMLGFFKYFNFFVSSASELLSSLGFAPDEFTLSIILPVGISFYTFQTLSYTIDIYRGKLTPTKDLVAFLAFVAFFPQLVAGPIERASQLLPQFLKPRAFDPDVAIAGLRIMLWGFFKKVVIADRLGEYVEIVYSAPGEFTGLPVMLATLFFALQIYCDFSGYSDIAIGTARLLGFDLMTNFRTPYFSTSLREFWQRWHISLSSWFRDYVYIPLGGGRVSAERRIMNLMITFVVSGLWHGASWTFVIWGAIHGVVLSIESLFRTSKNESLDLTAVQVVGKWMRSVIKMAFVFSIVCVAWVFFRAQNLGDAILLLGNSFTGLPSQLSSWQELDLAMRSFVPSAKEFKFLGYAMILFAIVELQLKNQNFSEWIGKWPTVPRWAMYNLVAIAIVYLGAFNKSSQFIYFQF